MRTFPFVLGLLLASVGSARAQELKDCDSEGVCIYRVSDFGSIRFFAKSLTGVAITVTFFVTSNNMSAAVAFPFSKTFIGKKKKPAFTLRPAHPGSRTRYDYHFRWNWGGMRPKLDESLTYRLPFAAGESFMLTQGYHGKFTHTGDQEYAVDFRMPVGTPVLAARGGIVVVVIDSFTEGGMDRSLMQKANLVKIVHSDGTVGEYAHFKYGGIRVSKGDRVKAGQLLGYSGNIGYTSEPHVHFEVYHRVDAERRQTIPVSFRVNGGQSGELKPDQEYTAVP